MKVEIDITRMDYWNFNKYVFRRIFILNLILVPMIILIFSLIRGESSIVSILVSFVISFGVALICNMLLICFLIVRTITMSKKNSGILGEHTIEIDEKGVREICLVSEVFSTWSGIYSIKQNKKYIYIFINKSLAYLVPKRAFSSIGEANYFYGKLVHFWRNEG